MVDSRALQSKYVWPQTVADRKCTYGAYSYASASTAPKQQHLQHNVKLESSFPRQIFFVVSNLITS